MDLFFNYEMALRPLKSFLTRPIFIIAYIHFSRQTTINKKIISLQSNAALLRQTTAQTRSFVIVQPRLSYIPILIESNKNPANQTFILSL